VATPRSQQVFRITGAPTSLTEDMRGRQRRYLLSMGLRTLCFVGAVLVSGPFRWVLVVGAVLLPYLAVVFANAGRTAAQPPPPTTEYEPVRNALETPPERPQDQPS
jgi:Protein of unknown function (DUF3099)